MPGGPNRPNRGAIPPVPPGPLHAPNLTPPTIEGLTVQVFQEVRAAPTPAHSPWSRTPPSAPGARHAGVPPMRVRTHVAMRAQALRTFFELLSQAKATQTAPPQLPPELANLDQLRVLLDALPDYHADDEQPSYVLAIPCRPIVVGLCALVPTSMPCFSSINWGALLTSCATDVGLTQQVAWG